MRVYDTTDKNSRVKLIYATAKGDDCIICDKPRTLDPTRGGCGCIEYVNAMQEADDDDGGLISALYVLVWVCYVALVALGVAFLLGWLL